MNIKDLWGKTKWIRWIIGTILMILGLIYGVEKYPDLIVNINSNDIINVQNSNLENSPIIQKSQNISVTYSSSSSSGGIDTFFHNMDFWILDSFYKNFKGNYDVFNVMIIMPDGQKAFMEQIEFNTSYNIAKCNEEGTDCYIFNEFRMNKRKESDVCFRFVTRLGNKELVSDILQVANKLLSIEKCLKKV